MPTFSLTHVDAEGKVTVEVYPEKEKGESFSPFTSTLTGMPLYDVNLMEQAILGEIKTLVPQDQPQDTKSSSAKKATKSP